jgi:hypothetical protein
MISSQHERISKLCAEHLEKSALTDTIRLDLIGPALTLVESDNGPQPAIGWQVTITVKHNKLLGLADVGVSAGIPRVLPDDLTFTRVCDQLLDQARALREQMYQQAMEDPAATASQQLPEGLRGAKLRV